LAVLSISAAPLACSGPSAHDTADAGDLPVDSDLAALPAREPAAVSAPALAPARRAHSVALDQIHGYGSGLHGAERPVTCGHAS
jgi:hypothetical protein